MVEYKYKHIHIDVYMHRLHTYVHTYIHTYIHKYAHTHMHTFICACMYLHTYIHRCIHRPTINIKSVQIAVLFFHSWRSTQYCYYSRTTFWRGVYRCTECSFSCLSIFCMNFRPCISLTIKTSHMFLLLKRVSLGENKRNPLSLSISL